MADQSIDDSPIDRFTHVVRTASGHSIFLTLLRRTRESIANSRIGSLPGWIGTATRESFIYRWLTKDPDPEVIVIDLRDTLTVGPIIAVVDRGIERISPYWAVSSLNLALDRGRALVTSLAQTPMGRRIAELLEPPEPPEKYDDE